MNKKHIVAAIIIIIISLFIAIYISNQNLIKEKNEEINSSYEIFEENEKYGVIDKNKKVIIKAEYEDIIIPNENKAVFFCYNDEERKILNYSGKEIFLNYKNVELIANLDENGNTVYEKNVFTFEKNGKVGIVNSSENIILEAKYDEISSVEYKIGEILIKQNDKYGIIKENGESILKTKYENIVLDDYYTENDGYKKAGYIVCQKTSDGFRYGYFDYNGTMVLNTEFNELSRVTQIISNNIYLLASKNGQYGVFVDGTKIINNQYQSILYESSLKVFIVEKTGKYGVLNENGVEILKTENNSVQVKGMFIYTQNGEEYKVYDKSGKETQIPFDSTIIQTSSNDYYLKMQNVEDKTFYSIIDKYYKELFEQKYSYLEYAFDKYFIAVDENGKSGLIDDKGNVLLEFKYNSIHVEESNIRAIINDEEIEDYNLKLEKIEQAE